MLLLCKRLPEGLFVTSHLQEVMLRYLRSFPDESSKLADMIEMCRMIHGINMFFLFFLRPMVLSLYSLWKPRYLDIWTNV